MSLTEAFMEQLRSGLAAVPKATADDVIQYYAEYFDDARQAGMTDVEVLAKTGPADQVVRAILDELSIAATQEKPSPGRLLRTSHRMLGKGVARAAKGTTYAILSLFPLSGSIVLYISAFAMVIAALVVATALIFNIVTHPNLTMSDILGQAGLIAALSSFCMVLALLLRLAANLLARLTMRLFRKIADRPDATGAATKNPPRRRSLAARVVAVLLILLFFSGLTTAAAYGLPQQYFRLWNSERPTGIQTISHELTADPESVRNIRINGLNANITILPSADSKLRLVYESAPYTSMEWALTNDTLSLVEKANGRLPFFDLLAIHKGTTSLLVYLPENTKDRGLDVRSIGGDITVEVPYGNGSIQTHSGDISVLTSDGNVKGSVFSRSGKVTYKQ